jgi:hypothetical protein
MKADFLRRFTPNGSAGTYRLPAPLRALRHSVSKDIATPLQQLLAISVAEFHASRTREHPNPLNHFGRKVFSQNDEDGITFEILRRLGLENGVFAEFGVGDGRENNTLVLAAMGWKGFWIGAEDLALQLPSQPQPNFAYLQRYVTNDNILSLTTQCLDLISETTVDVLSIDLDGNDFHFVETLLKGGLRPALYILEYNAKFMPPIRWRMPYNAAHRWNEDDYRGASLMDFVDLLGAAGYSLVCCNAWSGSNAFFVQSSQRANFSDISDDINVLWSPPYDGLRSAGHPVSAKTVASIIREIGSVRRANRVRMSMHNEASAHALTSD